MKKTSFLLVALVLSLFVAEATAQCSSCGLTGPSTILQGRTASFSTPATSGASYFWSVVGSGLRLASGNTATSVRVTATGAAGASGRICVARYRNGTVPCSTCKTVRITATGGCVLTSVRVLGTPVLCPTNYRAVTNPATVSGSVNYLWTITNGRILSGQGTRAIRTTRNAGSVSVRVTACNKSVTGNGFGFCEPDCGPRPCIEPRIAPNPSDNGFSITFYKNDAEESLDNKKTSLSSEKRITSVALMDYKGQTIKAFETQEDSVYIDTFGFTPGAYYVKISDDQGNSVTKSIVVK